MEWPPTEECQPTNEEVRKSAVSSIVPAAPPSSTIVKRVVRCTSFKRRGVRKHRKHDEQAKEDQAVQVPVVEPAKELRLRQRLQRARSALTSGRSRGPVAARHDEHEEVGAAVQPI